MTAVWYTSDLHIGHARVANIRERIAACPPPERP